MPAALPAPSGSPERSPARLRLPPEVRSSQILDAALALFSEHGFAAARMDDIARRCGLSKGGLYAHFASKDEVFEALIARALAAPELALPPLPAPLDLAQWVDWLLEQVHQRFADPQLRATLRLLVAEGERVSDLVAQWHAQVVQPFVEALGQWFAVGQAPMPSERSQRSASVVPQVVVATMVVQ
ncbi:MAG TPA: helix-turn-helix domain-containing protein [Burkholderiaceae bacterium]